MKRYIGTLGILRFLVESKDSVYPEQLIALCMEELDHVVQKSLSASAGIQGTLVFKTRLNTHNRSSRTGKTHL